MLQVLIAHAYAWMIPLSLIEGPIVALAGGVGAATGRINPYLTFLIVMAGGLFQDVVYYGLGRRAMRSERVRALLKRTRLLRDGLEPLKTAWRDEMFATLAASKFAYGLYAPLIVSAGVAEAPFGRFLWRSTLLSAVVLAGWLLFGFALARAYGVLGSAANWITAGLAAVSMIGLVFVGRVARRRVASRT